MAFFPLVFNNLVCKLSLLKVQQSLEKIARLEQEKEHWMLEAQLAKIKLEKENQKLKNSLSGHLTETIQEHSVLPNVAEQKKETTEKSLREPIRSTSLVSAPFSSIEKKPLSLVVVLFDQWNSNSESFFACVEMHSHLGSLYLQSCLLMLSAEFGTYWIFETLFTVFSIMEIFL